MCNIKRFRYSCKHVRTAEDGVFKCNRVKKQALKQFKATHGKVSSKLGKDGEFLFAKNEEVWITNWVGKHKCEGNPETLWFQVKGSCPACRDASGLGPKKPEGFETATEKELDKQWEREQEDRLRDFAAPAREGSVRRAGSTRVVPSSRAGSTRRAFGGSSPFGEQLSPLDSVSNYSGRDRYRGDEEFERFDISAPEWDEESDPEGDRFNVSGPYFDTDTRNYSVWEADSDAPDANPIRKPEMKESPARPRTGAVPVSDIHRVMSGPRRRRSDDTLYRAPSPPRRRMGVPESLFSTDWDGPTLVDPPRSGNRVTPSIITIEPRSERRTKAAPSVSSRRSPPTYPDVLPKQYPKMRNRRDF